MPSPCVPPEQMRAFLAEQLTPGEEQTVAEHVDECADCERLAIELSDDRQARELAAASHRRPGASVSDSVICDLRHQLRALAVYEKAAAGAGEPRQEDNGRDRPLMGAGDGTPAVPHLTRLGRYQILRMLGEGAFGVVYLAEDERLHRAVALKIARPSVILSVELRARFFREAEALARLSHPHIVPVYEAGEIDGLCFLAIAFCDGPTLDEWLQEQGGPVKPVLAARLLLLLAEAVEHAHAHGILHRDIKPGNILLQTKDEGADPPLLPQLTDFGLAKFVEEQEQSHATLSGVVLGTPQFMSPEQAAGHIERIGPTTDVYALGAVLYQMLTAQPPIEGNSTIDTLRRLLIDEPPPAKSLVSAVPDDLDAIALKCLEKSPHARYATAGELAADLRRFLQGLPTKARPLTGSQRLTRWVQRNPLLTGLAALAAVVVALSLGIFNYASRLSDAEEAKAGEAAKAAALAEQVKSSARSLAERQYADAIRVAATETAQGNTAHAVEALRGQVPGPGKPDLRGLGWHYLWAINTEAPLAEADAGNEVYQVRLSPDERELAAACKDGLLRLYDAGPLHLKAVVQTGQGEINGAAYSPDGQLIATTGDDGTICVIELKSRHQRSKIAAHPDKSYGVLFYDGSQKLASCGSDELIRLWDIATGQPLGTLAGHTKSVETLALSPDGKLLASAAADKTAIVWDLAAGRILHTLKGHRGRLTTVCFSPDGQILATAAIDRTIRLWDVPSGRRLTEQPCLDDVQSIAFSADGSRLFAAMRSGTLRVFQMAPARPHDSGPQLTLATPDYAWLAHSARVWSVTASSRQPIVYTAGMDGLVRRWAEEPQERVQRTIPATPGDGFVALDFTADGKQLFVLRESSGVAALDASTLKQQLALPSELSPWRSLEVLEGRDEVAAGNADGIVAIWNWKTGERVRLIDQHARRFAVTDLIYSPKTNLLAVLPDDAEGVLLYDPDSGVLKATLPTSNHTAIAFAPNGQRVAVHSHNDILLYDVKAGQQPRVLHGHTSTVNALAYSPDGQTLASGSSDRTVRLWSADGRLLTTLTEHYSSVSHVGFTPDGKSLVCTEDTGKLRVMPAQTATAAVDIPTQTDRLRGLALAPDSRQIAVIRAAGDILLIGVPAKR